MKLFLVRNRDGKYLCIEYSHLISWEAEEEASIYHSQLSARAAGQYAFDCEDDADKKFDIVTVETYRPDEVSRHLVLAVSDGEKETLVQVAGQINDRHTDDYILYFRRIGTNDIDDGIERGGWR